MNKFLNCLLASCLVFASVGCSQEPEGEPEPIPGLQLDDVPGFDDPGDGEEASGDPGGDKASK